MAFTGVVTFGGIQLNSAPWTVLFRGTKIPPAPVKRQYTGTLFRDAEPLVASAFGNRTMTLRVFLDVATDPSSAYGYIADLYYALDATISTLVWQPLEGVTAVTFITLRASDWEPVEQDWGLGFHTLDLHIPCSPLANGETVFEGVFHVAHDPAEGSAWFDLAPSAGDKHAPAMLSLDDDGRGVHRVIATRRRGDVTAGAWMLGPQDMAPVDDGTRRLTLTYPPAGSDGPSVLGPDHAGKYRVFARLTPTDPEATTTAWMSYGEPGHDAVNGTKATVTGGGTFWHDLGMIQVPFGARTPTLDLFGPRPVAGGPVHFHHDGPDLMWGQVAFLPADSELAIIRCGPAGPSKLILDGHNRACYRTCPDTGARLSTTPVHAPHHLGGLPHIGAGGQATRVLMLSGLAGGAEAGPGSTAVEVRHRPLHAHVAAHPDMSVD